MKKNTRGAQASKVARAIAAAKGHDPDGVFLYLIERFYNGHMTNKERVALGLSLMPYTRRRLAPQPIEEVKEAIKEGARLIVVAGDAAPTD